ncbi:glycosyltransferase family 2 protein [Candidatus Synechococcus spongiarum]|uniref:Cellulose synthase catalytic subunit n=1 Tax=Candidatus Synechococcus spongiarum TaxID=431041 RepID=A0A165B041_9SYNE|nr:cellulose synthase catalytic subunit [Candidatus Synechococcus spongiarum]SAY38381.1 Cellulose synthase catalytic subunit [Candidatus Synechococcus spongiarum]
MHPSPGSFALNLLPTLLVVLTCCWLTRRPEAQCRPWRRRLAIVLIISLAARYLLWRVLFGLNQQSPMALGLSWLLLACEGWLILTGLLQIGLSFSGRRDHTAAAKDGEARLQQWPSPPTVDVLIPCCGEPLALLERTIIACCRLDYPAKTVWLLDDGPEQGETDPQGHGSPRQRCALAQSLGARYHRRHGRQDAKAGNLNAVLPHCRGELLAVFDADMVPQPQFLRRTVGLFLRESRLGFVQTPQSYMTPDPLMRNLAMEDWLLPDEESFYRWIEPVRDSVGAVVCAGTSFLMRRRALDQVGGFSTDSLSEDLATGIRLIALGWQGLFLPEKLSAGLAAPGVADFARQRLRWCRGTLQTLRSPRGPLRISGLGWLQRLAFLEGALHWFNAIPRLVLLVLPLSTGLLGILPINLNGASFLMVFLPYWLSLLLLVSWLNRESRSALLPELYSWLLTPVLAWAVVQTLLAPRWRPGFRVTSKTLQRPQFRWAWSLVLPILVLFVLNGWNLLGLLSVLPPSPAMATMLSQQQAEGNRFVGLLWSGLNLVGLLTALRACLDPPRTSGLPTFRVRWPARLSAGDGGTVHHVQVCRINEQEVVVEPKTALTPGDGGHLAMEAAVGAGQASPVLKVTAGATPGHGRLLPQNQHQRRDWLHWLYATPGRWHDPTAPVEWQAMLALLRRLLWWRDHPTGLFIPLPNSNSNLNLDSPCAIHQPPSLKAPGPQSP